MAGWILTLGLQNLRNQINAWAPERDHASDGTIGDAAHQAGISGHDPDDVPGSHAEWNGDPDSIPEVRAIDVDTDFRNGVTAQQLVDHIVALKPSSVLRYVIYNRRIWEASNGWNPRPYTGTSPHAEHVHFSGAYTQAADNNTTFDYKLEEIPVALTAADKTWITSTVATQAAKAVEDRLDNIAKAVLVDYRFDGTQTKGSAYRRNLSELVADPWSMIMRGDTFGGDPIPGDSMWAQLIARLTALESKIEALPAGPQAQ